MQNLLKSGSVARQTALEVFQANIGDAERLIALTRLLLNTRTYRMRRELRESFGDAMRISRKRWNDLDCVESADVFVVLKPDGRAAREHFTEPELRPLLRQAVVAISAAVESYVAEKACSFVSEAMKMDPLPPRLRQVSVSFEDVLWIEQNYERRGWGHRALLREHLVTEASSDPDQIGRVFSTVGRTGLWALVDKERRVVKGTSEREMKDLASRRNQIAHSGDRVGRGRASLDLEDVEDFYANTKAVVEAIDAVLT